MNPCIAKSIMECLLMSTFVLVHEAQHCHRYAEGSRRPVGRFEHQLETDDTWAQRQAYRRP